MVGRCCPQTPLGMLYAKYYLSKIRKIMNSETELAPRVSDCGVPREGRGLRCSNLPPKFRRPYKIVPNSTRLWKLLKIAEFRTPTLQDVRKKGCKFLELPPVRNCFTLAMTNKLVVIIDSLKIGKIKKILLHEMKFLLPNNSCLQNPWVAVTAPRSPFSVLKWICWKPPLPERNSWVRHWFRISYCGHVTCI